MSAMVDRDHEPLERWSEMAEAETAVVYDARLGGHAVTLDRHRVAAAAPPRRDAGRRSGAVVGRHAVPAVVEEGAAGHQRGERHADRSWCWPTCPGFDGSPESLRRLQLEYGAEIGRAIVNFDGPIVLCVVSRYHGGAFVVFSATLNDDMEVLAVEGSFASVIGGAPAAAVVFTREVDDRTRADERVRALEAAVADAGARRSGALPGRAGRRPRAVRTEKLGEVAAEFDAVHSVERAKDVGSVHRIIAAADLRPELIAAVERGMARIDARLPR